MRTVASILRDARVSKKITLIDAEKATKIKIRYLVALEHGDWNKLPSSTFIMGFIRNYSAYLGLNPETVLALFRREYVLPSDTSLLPKGWISPLDRPPLVITPRLVVGIMVGLVLILFFGYLFMQYRFFVGAPVLQLESPVQEQKLTQAYVDVIGKTDSDAQLTINGQPVVVSGSGTFAQSVSLTEGVNIIRVVSTNRFGKETEIVRTIFVENGQ